MQKRNKMIRTTALVLSLLLVSVAVILSVTGVSSAKYKTTKSATAGGTVSITVSADLATGLAVLEHRADRQPSGVYSLADEEVGSNSYVIMPGVDIDKDPFVRVTGKTELPGYLYVEVVNAVEGGDVFVFAVDSSNWAELDGITGPNGGSVYVYAPGGTPVALDNTNTDNGNLEVSILESNKIEIKSSLDVGSDLGDATLTFYAYMVQATDGTAESLFRTQIL